MTCGFDAAMFNDAGNGMPVIRIRDVIRGYSETYYSGEYPTESVVHDGDFLIGMDGEFNIGVWNGGPSLLNQRVCKIVPKISAVEPSYLLQILPRELKYIEARTPFVTVKHLSMRELRALKLSLPPIFEQRRIAAILDKADAIRKKRRDALQLTDEFLRSVFLNMFGDPKTNLKDWKSRKLATLGDLQRGKSRHRPRNEPSLYGGAYPFVQTGDVANCNGVIEKYQQTYSDLGLQQSRLWKKGTLCITIAANIGKTGILGFDACFPDSIVGFTPGAEVTSEYIQFWLGCIQGDLEREAPQVAQKNINLEILSCLDTPLPPLPLQKKFSSIAMKIRSAKTKYGMMGVKADNLFASLSHRAFSGKL